MNNHLANLINNFDYNDLEIESPFSAEIVFEKLRDRIIDFEDGLEAGARVAILISGLGGSVLMSVETITYKSPSLICLAGTIDGKRSECIQHMNQLNIVLMAVSDTSNTAAPRRIGFVQSQG